MKLKLFKTLWGHTGCLDDAIAACRENDLAGIEGPAPAKAPARHEFQARLADARLDYIAEICTGESYVPDRQLSPYKHLESFRRKAADCNGMPSAILDSNRRLRCLEHQPERGFLHHRLPDC